MKLEENIARIIDPAGWAMRPSAYGLKTEKEMLERTMVGAVRSVAIKKAREILAVINHQFDRSKK